MFGFGKDQVIQIQLTSDGQRLYALTKEGKLYVGRPYKKSDEGDEFLFNEINVTVKEKK